MIPFADLHSHTLFSDGTATPKEIIDLALEKGFKGFSITDHDTIEAYDSLGTYAQERGLAVLYGVEFSCTHNGESVHVLGYDFDPLAKPLQDLCRMHKERRETRNRHILENLKRHNVPLTLDDLSQETLHIMGRPHIARAMVKKGYVKDLQEAFDKYLAEGAPCYENMEECSVEETLSIIHQSRGLAIIAHPHMMRNKALLDELIALPFDGIECRYASMTKEQCAPYIKISQEKKWLLTAGSDYHGRTKPNQPYGTSFVTKEEFFILKNAPRKVPLA